LVILIEEDPSYLITMSCVSYSICHVHFIYSCIGVFFAICFMFYLCLRSQGVIQPLVNVKHEYAAFRADLVEQWSDMQQMVGSLAPAMQRLVDGNQRLASQYVRSRVVLCFCLVLVCGILACLQCIRDMIG
jgi:hypothetical protein